MDPGDDKPSDSFLDEKLSCVVCYGGCLVLLLRRTPFGSDEQKGTKV